MKRGRNGWKADIASVAVANDTNAMHPFPHASQLQFLVDKELEQICLGFWQLQFRFETGHISVEGDIEHVDGEGNVRRHNASSNAS